MATMKHTPWTARGMHLYADDEPIFAPTLFAANGPHPTDEQRAVCEDLAKSAAHTHNCHDELVAVLGRIIHLVDEGDYGEIYDKDMGERSGYSPYVSGEMNEATKQARTILAKATKGE